MDNDSQKIKYNLLILFIFNKIEDFSFFKDINAKYVRF